MATGIRRCLEKDPRHRIQTARDVANEFRDLAQQPPHKTAPQIPAQATSSSPAPNPGAPSRTVLPADSDAARAEGFWVAVSPFKSQGSSAEIATLADGLSEKIVTGLSLLHARANAREIAGQAGSKFADRRWSIPQNRGNQLGGGISGEWLLMTQLKSSSLDK